MKINWLKVIMFLLIVVIIINQVRIVKILIEKQEMLDADPLVYGAKRYGIEYCSCIISPTKTIEFTQNYSKTIIRRESKNDLDFSNFTFEVKGGDE